MQQRFADEMQATQDPGLGALMGNFMAHSEKGNTYAAGRGV